MELLINQKEQSHCERPLANHLTSMVSQVSKPPNWEMIEFPLKMHCWEPSVVNNRPSAPPFGFSGSSRCFPQSIAEPWLWRCSGEGPCVSPSQGSSPALDMWKRGDIWREESRDEAITNSDVIVTRRVCWSHSGDQSRCPVCDSLIYVAVSSLQGYKTSVFFKVIFSFEYKSWSNFARKQYSVRNTR